jgi:uncharacterized protein YqjF (DUF2071 family)
MKFLDAEWRYLAMINYEIDPELIRTLVPNGTEVDFFNNRTYVSLVGFLFLKTKVFGVPIPFHRNFEEVNLRFYVRRLGPEGWRRGVVFIKEIVPRWAVAAVARALYHERYVAMRMRHSIDKKEDDSVDVKYEWKSGEILNCLSVVGASDPKYTEPGSEEEFISEHYWGYSSQPDGSTVEYRVDHPKWKVHKVLAHEVNCNFAMLYGERFSSIASNPPTSAFLAAGSPITVSTGTKISPGNL